MTNDNSPNCGNVYNKDDAPRRRRRTNDNPNRAAGANDDLSNELAEAYRLAVQSRQTFTQDSSSSGQQPTDSLAHRRPVTREAVIEILQRALNVASDDGNEPTRSTANEPVGEDEASAHQDSTAQ